MAKVRFTPECHPQDFESRHEDISLSVKFSDVSFDDGKLATYALYRYSCPVCQNEIIKAVEADLADMFIAQGIPSVHEALSVENYVMESIDNWFSAPPEQ